MSTGRFAKRDRERAKRERAVLKQERRDQRRTAEGEGEAESPPKPQAEVLDALAALHEAYDREEITFDEFEASKAELLAELRIQ